MRENCTVLRMLADCHGLHFAAHSQGEVPWTTKP